MLQLTVSTDFDFESAEYEELFRESDVTAFQHPAWQSAMQKHIHGLPGFTVKTLLMHCAETSKLMGVIPLVARKVMRTTILEYSNLGLVDYALPTLHRQFWKNVPDAQSLSKKLDQALGNYDMLRIKHMPSNDPDLLRLFPNSYMERAEFSAHATELDDDYDVWRERAISKSERKHRDKKRRAMMRAGEWRLELLTEEGDIRQAFDHMRSFHKPRYKDRPGQDLLQDPDAFRFYVDLAVSQAKEGYARTYQFTFNGEVVAVQFGITYSKRYLYLMMGVDFEQMGKYSPGLLMAEDIIRDCIKDGMKIFDLTVGDEPYKYKFGTQPIPIYTLWHAHSMLGVMGRTVKDIVQKRHIPDRLRRWVS